jgi:4-hydroxy-tetrahydrodipicolinate synthase
MLHAINMKPMTIPELFNRRKLGRKPQGMAACLLPYSASGDIAFSAFAEQLNLQRSVGLMSAINMDTGYANLLSATERSTMLRFTRDHLGAGHAFVAGVFVEGLEGDLRELYRTQMAEIAELGGIPILFQTTRFHNWSDAQIIDLYASVCEGFNHVLAFELGKMFAPNGMIYNETIIAGLMCIPQLKGMKHSSLNRLTELERLATRDRLRPDFRIYTGNDLGIDMIEYGSDYLLGLAAFCPEKFAERDALWAAGDAQYYALSDALQYLGNVGFRAPVPAYKHSCAVFQHVLGRIPTSATHPRCPQRPVWEVEQLKDCALRLGYQI